MKTQNQQFTFHTLEWISLTCTDLLQAVDRHRRSCSTASECNVYSLVADFLTMKMRHSLACFFHAWHMHEANTRVVWKHLHPDVEYLTGKYKYIPHRQKQDENTTTDNSYIRHTGSFCDKNSTYTVSRKVRP